MRRSARNTLRCYSSGEPGHRQTACPNQTRRGLLVDENYTTRECEFAASDEEEIEQHDLVHITNGDVAMWVALWSCTMFI